MKEQLAPPSLDCLRRLQQTLLRRVASRDAENILSVGFSPVQPADAEETPILVRFNVAQKRKRVAAQKRIEPIEPVRLLDRSTETFREWQLPTQVRQSGEVVPTGVAVSTADGRATTSLVIRWTTVRPLPPRPDVNEPDDPRWRWGLMTVSHLFVGRGDNDRQNRAAVRRVSACGGAPEAIRSRMVARGRIPGGPDVAIVETGWDRLHLSGFIPQTHLPPLTIVTAADLRKWTSVGTTGDFVGDQVIVPWTWQAFYPTLVIPTLGRLQHVVAYERKTGTDISGATFGPGSSGGVLVTGGLVLGLQVGAMQPRFDVGYAQTLDVGVAWLQQKLSATALDCVHVVTATS